VTKLKLTSSLPFELDRAAGGVTAEPGANWTQGFVEALAVAALVELESDSWSDPATDFADPGSEADCPTATTAEETRQMDKSEDGKAKKRDKALSLTSKSKKLADFRPALHQWARKVKKARDRQFNPAAIRIIGDKLGRLLGMSERDNLHKL